MDSPENQIYRFADVEIEVLSGHLKRGGEERHLRHKTFQVLVYLLEHRGRLVTKEELFAAVWKDTAVTDDALVQSVKDIRRALGDNSHRPRFIKTVPKSGYLFIGTLQAPNSIQESKEQKPKTNDRKPISFFKSRVVLITIFISIIALSLLLNLSQTFRQQTSEITLTNAPGKKPVVVMFFENQSGDTQLDWLREGLTDMLITNLSRSDKFTVLSRAQLYVLLERIKRDSAAKISLDEALEIARRTGAETVITGSFARLGEKMRLEVQLYDVKTGGLNAAENLTVDRAEQILTEIDLLSLKLANRLGAGESEPEKASGLADAMTNNLEAYRYYSLALEKARGLHKKDSIELLEKAVALDPDFAMAHARIGYVYAIVWGWGEKAKPHLERAFQLSDRLTEKDRLYIAAWYALANLDFPSAIPPLREIIQKYPLETEAYLRLGYLLRGEEKFDEAISVMRQGLTIDPESSGLYNALGLLYSLLGRHDEAIAAHQRYVALAPGEPNAHDSLGMSYQWAGRYGEAIAEYNRSLELNPNFDIAQVHLGVVYFQTGRYRTAIECFKKYIAVAPSNLERSRGYAYISQVHRRLKNYVAATASANKAFEEYKGAVFELYSAALESGDLKTAKKLEEQLFAKFETSNRGSRNTPRYSFYFRGYVGLKTGQTNEALENFSEALRHAPATWEIDPLEDCLANTYLETGRFDEAIAEYERILRLNPNYPLARFYLAQAFERKGQTGKAHENYLMFLEIWKDADANIPEVMSARKTLAN